MENEIQRYNQAQKAPFNAIADILERIIKIGLPEAEFKIWHAHPVWFLAGNPIVGYSVQKKGLRLMFWSGADFSEPRLIPSAGKFKDASIFYSQIEEIQQEEIITWLEKSRIIQWDYKNIVKRKGKLERL